MRKTNRKALFLNRDIIRGRFLKDGEGEGGGTPTPTPVSTGAPGGNSSQPGSGESANNNAGEAFDASAFWGSQSPDGSGSPGSESASGDDSGSDTEQLRNDLTERLNTLQFGEPVMTQEIFEAAQNGDFNGFQSALNGALGQAVRQSLGLTTAILRPFAEQILSEVRGEIQSTLRGRDDNDQLIKDFPAAQDGNVRRMIQPIFDQALRNTKGDRALAVKQVKEMMRLMTGATADDLGLNVAPRSADDSGRPPNRAVNWLDELSAQ